MRAVLIGVILWALCAVAGPAQELSALARLEAASSSVEDAGGGIDIHLALDRPVPWRVRVMDNPPRLVLDFREVDFTPLSRMAQDSAHVTALRAGQIRRGWSRLVLQLDGPFLIGASEMRTDRAADLRIRLAPAAAAAFAEKAALPEPPGWAVPPAADVPQPVARGTGPLVVVLDPGHGGIDPGAERDGLNEKTLMLTFARELKEVLLRDGGFKVVMTRDEDVFVPLETRISIARKAGAQVFVALHADSLAEGEATGATLYTLSDQATDAAARALAERHNRDDLLSGLDLAGQDDLVTTVLIDMARARTQPRVERLADALEASIKGAGLKMHRHAHQEAALSVLKSPDIPSILIEVGFLSSPGDMARLTDAGWRAKMAAAIRDGLKAWAKADAVQSGAGP